MFGNASPTSMFGNASLVLALFPQFCGGGGLLSRCFTDLNIVGTGFHGDDDEMQICGE